MPGLFGCKYDNSAAFVRTVGCLFLDKQRLSDIFGDLRRSLYIGMPDGCMAADGPLSSLRQMHQIAVERIASPISEDRDFIFGFEYWGELPQQWIWSPERVGFVESCIDKIASRRPRSAIGRGYCRFESSVDTVQNVMQFSTMRGTRVPTSRVVPLTAELVATP